MTCKLRVMWKSAFVVRKAGGGCFVEVGKSKDTRSPSIRRTLAVFRSEIYMSGSPVGTVYRRPGFGLPGNGERQLV